MKVIFLDVDGVLNCLNRWHQLPDLKIKGEKVCEVATARLKRIVDATGAKIVVSSTWRSSRMKELTEWLRTHGMDCVIGRTPVGSEMPSGVIVLGEVRGLEIQAWLNQHPEVESFVIIDDSADMAHLMPHLVQTTWSDGLLDEHIEPAVAMLNIRVTETPA